MDIGRPERPESAAAEMSDFRAQCERSVARPLHLRLRYGFVSLGEKSLKPRVNIAFDSCVAYRKWCRENYPRYSGMWPAEEPS